MTRAYQSTIKRNAYITLVSNTVLAVMRSHFIFKCILLFNMVPPVVSMPGHYDYDRLPPMHDNQDNKLMWDGIPSPYFVECQLNELENMVGKLQEMRSQYVYGSAFGWYGYARVAAVTPLEISAFALHDFC